MRRVWEGHGCCPPPEGAKVVAYASRSLLEHEKKWKATESEAAVLVWALETFRPYIDGVHVTIRTDHAPLEYIRSKIDRCKRLERWALRLQEFRFTIQPRPGAQQKHVDALSRAPVPAEPDQQPIVLDEFLKRVVLLVQCGRKCTPCMVVQRLAEREQAPRRGLRRRGTAVSFVAQVQQVGATSGKGADGDGCQVLLTDGEESHDADAALVAPGKETDVAMLGAGEGGVALPRAFYNADLAAAEAKDPDCLRYMPLVKKRRAQ